MEARDTQSPNSSTTVRPSQVVESRQAASSNRWSLEGSQAIRRRYGRLRLRSPPERTTRCSSHPKVQPSNECNERTSHDHIMWSSDKLIHQGATTGSTLRWRPASHSRNRRHLPEVRCLSAESDVPIVARWIASPAPSAPRVSHPLSGLIPAHPCGCCFKPHPPIGFMGLQSFSRRGQPGCLSAPTCSPAIGHSRAHRTSRRVCGRRHTCSASRTGMRDTPPEALAPELCSDRASDTPRDG